MHDANQVNAEIDERKLATVRDTFDQVIGVSQDQHFKSLLAKIKDAYHDYTEALQGRSTLQKEAHKNDLQQEKCKI